jgi:type IV pilus assembly protein PilW
VIARSVHVSPPARGRARGLTLVEVMVSMTLSLFIAAALGALVVNMSRAHAELDRSSRQIENGRYAVELLAEEIRLAGFYGDVRQAGAIYSQPDPCATNIAALGWSAAPITVPVALEGRSGSGDTPACVQSHRADTAVLALHRLSTEEIDADAVAGGAAFVQTSQCALDPFMPPLVVSSSAADFTLKNLACDTITPVRRYVSRIYYVATCSDCARDEIPTLKRVELNGAAWGETSLAEGIEEIQFEYGFDVDGDAAPDEYVTSLDGVEDSPLNDWSNVMTVRIWILSRATETTPGYADAKTYTLGLHGARGPYNDGFKRRVHTTLVRLNNPAGWRE